MNPCTYLCKHTYMYANNFIGLCSLHKLLNQAHASQRSAHVIS